MDASRRRHRGAKVEVVNNHETRGTSEMQATTIGLDIAKNVFQVHGTDARGRVVLRPRLTRAKVLAFFANVPRCVIGLEACGGAHYWARELIRLGHDARLMPPQYVKAYLKTNKHDVADAEACCEAVQRPSMRFVPVKSEAQQATLMVHRVRDQLIGQRTASINARRGHLAELGIVAVQRRVGLRQLLALRGELEDERIPPLARDMLQLLVGQIRELETKIASLDRRRVVLTRTDPVGRSLAEVPGIGPVIATAFAATVPDANVFRSGRHLAAWLGLVPRQHATGGKERRLGISKRGDGYLRRQLIHGARALVRISPGRTGKVWSWIAGLLARRPFNVVVAAVANKLARILWAMLSRGEAYRAA
jgi:transposase